MIGNANTDTINCMITQRDLSQKKAKKTNFIVVKRQEKRLSQLLQRQTKWNPEMKNLKTRE